MEFMLVITCKPPNIKPDVIINAYFDDIIFLNFSFCLYLIMEIHFIFCFYLSLYSSNLLINSNNLVLFLYVLCKENKNKNYELKQ